MKMSMSIKGLTPLLSGIMILLISIIFMSIILSFTISYFDKLNDLQKYNNNKDNLSLINNIIFELKTSDVHSYKRIYIDPTSKIEFNKLTNQIKIIQKIKSNDFYNNLKDSISYGNLDINKTLNNLEFTLDLNGIANIDNTATLNEGKQNISFIVTSISNNIPSIRIARVSENNWYDNNWSYRKRIIIDHNKIEGDLEDFPVLISISDDDLKDHAMNDGSDILFTSSDGKTKLYREIEDYNSYTGSLVAWVRIPELSSTKDTWIYIYYGNNSASETNDTEVWDENYVLVQHLNESPANDVEGHLDSTRYGNNGTPKDFDEDVNSTTDAIGKIAGADKFDGNSSYIYIPDNNSLDFGTNTNFTITFWIRPYEHVDPEYSIIGLLSKKNMGGQAEAGYAISLYTSGSMTIWFADGTNYIRSNLGTLDIESNSWHLINTVFNRNENVDLYIDGIKVGSKDISSIGNTDNSINLVLGRINNGYYYKYSIHSNDAFDNVNISNVARSDDWIKTEYNNQSDPSSFYSLSIEEIR